ncbi:uncharacterized protein EDB91DRAFT_316409 [Suillus paluster]|uniref:uncharacterized protein n=1 Tax=Suillus paluster TaxID=48578 RepID=UPI001B871BEE|nr:uncharacterized protein EDB91DRAFT_316409 [Suillus paluster]KAG1741824.1 hypothetical protein EDB91DRAFT_316409 [Suillus paluster]
MVRECNACIEPSSKLKRCSGCHKVWYCSITCQKSDWVRHIFACKPRRPINTADHLALAVRNDLLPHDPQTCKDYGFDRALTAENNSKLFGLYIGLIERMDIPAKTINDWRVRGVLVEEIKAAYSQIPAQSRGGYFPWFLQNQHLLTTSPQAATDSQLNDERDIMIRRAWHFTGGAETDSPEDIRTSIARMPRDKRMCHLFYELLLSKWYPAPFHSLWIPFGFCSCANEAEEMCLGRLYQGLITKCTFDEFCDAFSSARILNLFHEKGISVNVRNLGDALQGHNTNKSVWSLKQFAIRTDEENAKAAVRSPFAFDYGFMNCRNDSEKQALKKVYRTFFERRDADPLALHDAAIHGNIFGYIRSLMKLNAKYERLMKNPYPLPDVE